MSLCLVSSGSRTSLTSVAVKTVRWKDAMKYASRLMILCSALAKNETSQLKRLKNGTIGTDWCGYWGREPLTPLSDVTFTNLQTLQGLIVADKQHSVAECGQAITARSVVQHVADLSSLKLRCIRPESHQVSGKRQKQ